jgi:hypothetical protein
MMPTIQDAYDNGIVYDLDIANCMAQDWPKEVKSLLARAGQATLALTAATSGDLEAALCHAERACQLEAEEFGSCANWRPLRDAIREACMASRCARTPA